MGISINVAVISLSILFMMVVLCWMNNIPRKLSNMVRSCRQFLCRSPPPRPNQSPSPHPPISSDVDDIAIFEPMDDVQLFLAELRLSSMTQSTLNISNVARYEFISNLLITEKIEAATTTTSSSSTGYDGLSCAICLGEYQPGDIMCSSHNSKCNHRFHQCCIFRWLLQNRDDCPCCRNNYLALSDDDDHDVDGSVATPHPSSSSSSSSTDTFDVEDPLVNPTIQISSTNDVTELAWIPSYLAPFPPPSLRPTATVEPEVGEEPNTDPIAPSSSSTSSSLDQLPNSQPPAEGLTVSDETNASHSDDQDQMDPEVWSCPSVDDDDDDDDQEHWNNMYILRNKGWIPTRSTIRRTGAMQPRHNSNTEQTQSLQLDDLIVEGLMQRLQARTEVHNIGISSSSSSSVYTEGSTDLEASTVPNQSILVTGKFLVAREESELCAICRADYAVNEELCWSQDPLCAHVFHKSCMQQWIMEGHDFCPFCRRAHSNDAHPQQPSSSNASSVVDNAETLSNGQPQYPMVSSFVAATRDHDKVSSECLSQNAMDASARSERSLLDTDLDILAEV